MISTVRFTKGKWIPGNSIALWVLIIISIDTVSWVELLHAPCHVISPVDQRVQRVFVAHLIRICSPTEYSTTNTASRLTVVVWAVILDHQCVRISRLERCECVVTTALSVRLPQISSSRPLQNGQETVVSPTGISPVRGQLAPGDALVV